MRQADIRPHYLYTAQESDTWTGCVSGPQRGSAADLGAADNRLDRRHIRLFPVHTSVNLHHSLDYRN